VSAGRVCRDRGCAGGIVTGGAARTSIRPMVIEMRGERGAGDGPVSADAAGISGITDSNRSGRASACGCSVAARPTAETGSSGAT